MQPHHLENYFLGKIYTKFGKKRLRFGQI